MKIKDLLYEGKAKKVFSTENERYVVVEYKDDATAFNGVKKAKFEKKGEINNKISSFIFQLLKNEGVKTHFVERLADREQLVEKVDIIPLEVVVRNVVAGSLQKRTGLTEGTVIEPAIVEFYYKNDDLGDPLLNQNHIIGLLDIITYKELNYLTKETNHVNKILSKFFESKGISLIDFKLEFGYNMDGEVVLADEVSPDTCRLWDIKTKKKLDKDVFRFELGNLTESYTSICERLEIK